MPWFGLYHATPPTSSELSAIFQAVETDSKKTVYFEPTEKGWIPRKADSDSFFSRLINQFWHGYYAFHGSQAEAQKILKWVCSQSTDQVLQQKVSKVLNNLGRFFQQSNLNSSRTSHSHETAIPPNHDDPTYVIWVRSAPLNALQTHVYSIVDDKVARNRNERLATFISAVLGSSNTDILNFLYDNIDELPQQLDSTSSYQLLQFYLEATNPNTVWKIGQSVPQLLKQLSFDDREKLLAFSQTRIQHANHTYADRAMNVLGSFARNVGNSFTTEQWCEFFDLSLKLEKYSAVYQWVWKLPKSFTGLYQDAQILPLPTGLGIYLRYCIAAAGDRAPLEAQAVLDYFQTLNPMERLTIAQQPIAGRTLEDWAAKFPALQPLVEALKR